MIRRQQIQKWIKLLKIHAASLHFFKAKENKTCLLPCSIWRAHFHLLSKNLKSFQLNILIKISIGESRSKSRKKPFQNKRKSRKNLTVLSYLKKFMKMISTAQFTLIFMRPEHNLIQKKIRYFKALSRKTKMLSRKFLNFVRSFHQNS